MSLLSKMSAVKAGASVRRGEERRGEGRKQEVKGDRRGEREIGEGREGAYGTGEGRGDVRHQSRCVFTSAKLFS